MRISNGIQNRNRRMPNGTYGGVRGRKTKVGRKLLRFPPTRFVCVGTQLVDKHVISLKIHCLCGLSTYKTQLSTQYNPVNCTFATEI